MKKLILKVWGLTTAIRQAIARRRVWRQDRDAFMQLVWQEDRVLADAGYTRADINWAVNLPIHVNAAKALQRRVHGDHLANGKTVKHTLRRVKPVPRQVPASLGTDRLACPCY